MGCHVGTFNNTHTRTSIPTPTLDIRGDGAQRPSFFTIKRQNHYKYEKKLRKITKKIKNGLVQWWCLATVDWTNGESNPGPLPD